jgi:predicted unusual protein kinase regulating ubiquinone biosynthesis (AarF/ABC1/UbiB family)
MALKSIKSGPLSRGLALAKVTVSAGTKAASHALGNLFGDESGKEDRLREMLTSQMDLLSRELGKLKGSVMKVGQMLSMYGEHLLPPEANQLLKSLQNQSPPLAWEAIEKQLKRQLGVEKLALLDIDREPHASASLGQVHRAVIKATGERLALKIQYPGVDQAIESDLSALRSLLTMSKLIPKGPKYDELFKEVRQMMHQEVDYSKELVATDEFRELFADDALVVVPRTYPEFSSKRVLATSFEEGVSMESAEALSLSQERRNAIGLKFLDIYFRELFMLGRLQTDPHFGNYRVRLGADGEPDRLVLLDFGAVRKFPKEFLTPYFAMLRAVYAHDDREVEKAAEKLGFLFGDDPEELKIAFCKLCYLFTEPFEPANQPYDWGASDLPKRVVKVASDIVWGFRLRVPPREVVFLDRKMGGVFVVLSVLKVKASARELLESYIAKTPY